jgi:hypothetical protein
MADTKKSKTDLVESPKSPWYLSGFVLTERGLTAFVGGLQDIRAELVQTLSTAIDFADATGQRGAKLAHRLLDRVDGFTGATLETSESAVTALLSRVARTSQDAAEVAAKSASDLAA